MWIGYGVVAGIRVWCVDVIMVIMCDACGWTDVIIGIMDDACEWTGVIMKLMGDGG